MKKVTLISFFMLLMAVSYNSFAAYSSVSVTARYGSSDQQTSTVSLPAGVYGTYAIKASAGGLRTDARATANAQITGVNFSKYVNAYIEELGDDSDNKSGIVGSSANSLTYTISAYGFTEGKSIATASASVSW